jgi:hypothetical protein
MLRTWRKKEEEGREKKVKREEKEAPSSVGQREKFRFAYTRALLLLLLKNARPVFPNVRETREARVRIFASCHYVSVVQLRLQDIACIPSERAAAPVPRPFSLYKRAIRLAAVLTRVSASDKSKRKKGDERERERGRDNRTPQAVPRVPAFFPGREIVIGKKARDRWILTSGTAPAGS